MTSVSPIARVNGRDLHLTELVGPSGSFFVAYGGMRREAGHGFFYRDAQIECGFYASRLDNPKRWDVTRATSAVWSDLPFKTSQANDAYVRKNIEFFLHNRFFADPERLDDGSLSKIPVTFSWKIAQ